MGGLGVNVAVIQDWKLLLIQREDFEVWNLPGGEVDPGETPVQAAVREVKEETGLDVQLTRFVGLYTLPDWRAVNNNVALFVAEMIDGELQTQPNETIDVGFFDVNDLPEPMLWWQKDRIAHVIAGYRGLIVTQHVPWAFPKGMTRWDIYKMRDESGLSRSAFAFEKYGAQGETIIEVGGS